MRTREGPLWSCTRRCSGNGSYKNEAFLQHQPWVEALVQQARNITQRARCSDIPLGANSNSHRLHKQAADVNSEVQTAEQVLLELRQAHLEMRSSIGSKTGLEDMVQSTGKERFAHNKSPETCRKQQEEAGGTGMQSYTAQIVHRDMLVSYVGSGVVGRAPLR